MVKSAMSPKTARKKFLREGRGDDDIGGGGGGGGGGGALWEEEVTADCVVKTEGEVGGGGEEEIRSIRSSSSSTLGEGETFCSKINEAGIVFEQVRKEEEKAFWGEKRGDSENRLPGAATITSKKADADNGVPVFPHEVEKELPVIRGEDDELYDYNGEKEKEEEKTNCDFPQQGGGRGGGSQECETGWPSITYRRNAYSCKRPTERNLYDPNSESESGKDVLSGTEWRAMVEKQEEKDKADPNMFAQSHDEGIRGEEDEGCCSPRCLETREEEERGPTHQEEQQQQQEEDKQQLLGVVLGESLRPMDPERWRKSQDKKGENCQSIFEIEGEADASGRWKEEKEVDKNCRELGSFLPPSFSRSEWIRGEIEEGRGGENITPTTTKTRDNEDWDGSSRRDGEISASCKSGGRGKEGEEIEGESAQKVSPDPFFKSRVRNAEEDKEGAFHNSSKADDNLEKPLILLPSPTPPHPEEEEKEEAEEEDEFGKVNKTRLEREKERRHQVVFFAPAIEEVTEELAEEEEGEEDWELGGERGGGESASLECPEEEGGGGRAAEGHIDNDEGLAAKTGEGERKRE